MTDTKNSLIEYQLFPRKYFSGSDVYIIIGNTIVDEIRHIEFQIQQQVTPLYGYASYTADALAYGSRIVQGSFSINFRETGYLLSVLEGVSDSQAQASSTPHIYTGFPKDSKHIADLVRAGSYDKLKSTMEEYEDAIWGTDGSSSYRPYCEPKFLPSGNIDMKYNGFDIIISYGDEGFHIGDTIGEIPSTVEVINGVSITSMRKSIEPTGNNIIEEYTFMARDYNNPIGSKRESFSKQTEVAKQESTSQEGIKTTTIKVSKPLKE